MSTSSDSNQTASERLHGGWMEHKSSENKWNPVWCVLKRDGTLFFFTSQDTRLETHIGTLHLSRESSFHYGPGDQKDGYRFDLHILKKKKKFRVKKPYDREIWRAYLEGVITGSVPHDGNLSPQDIQLISSKFQHVQTSPPSPHPSHTPPSVSSSDRRPSVPVQLDGSSSSSSSWQLFPERRPSVPSLASTGTESSGEGGFDPPGQHSVVSFSLGDNSQHSSDSGVSDNTGGPFMHHKFDKDGNTSPPSWFFEDCSRELAEKILSECRHMGNTLMRVSGSARPTGSYVISKRLESLEAIVHYEVIRVAEGYKINAENTTSTMKTLREVMESFVQLSGPSTTRPMKTNDLKELGVHYDAYNRGPIVPHQDFSAILAAVSDPEEPDNYEIPEQQSTRGTVPRPSSIQHVPPSPAPPPPPCPAPAPPAPALPKAPFNTWGKDKAGDMKWQTQQAGSPAAKTLGPAERRHIKPENVKPSVMHVNQSLQEQAVVANLEAVIKSEEQRLQHRGVQSKPPPLPAVPANRPRLSSSPSTDYMNAASASPVPANVAPPSVVRPGVGGAGGGGSKVPPATAPKLVRFPPGREQATPSILPELQEKLRLRALQSEQTHPSTSLPPEDVEDEYEDISHYQNVSST